MREVAVVAARMDLVPAFLQQRIDQADASDKAGQIAIEDEQLGDDDQQPDIARALEQRGDRRELGGEIDRCAIERLSLRAGKERGRKDALGPRDAIHVVRVADQVEILTAGLLVRHRSGERREIDGRHPESCCRVACIAREPRRRAGHRHAARRMPAADGAKLAPDG